MKTYFAKITDFTQADYANMYSLLECAIREKIDAKKSEKSKQQSILGYSLLHKGINEIYKKKNFKIDFNPNGKPECDFCFFSISHSEKIVVCAFYDRPIGADIQKIANIKQRKRYKFFNEKECFYVNQFSNKVNERYTEIFSKKEAAIKMLGLSLSESLKIDTFSDDFIFKSQIIDDFYVVFCTEKM